MEEKKLIEKLAKSFYGESFSASYESYEDALCAVKNKLSSPDLLAYLKEKYRLMTWSEWRCASGKDVFLTPKEAIASSEVRAEALEKISEDEELSGIIMRGGGLLAAAKKLRSQSQLTSEAKGDDATTAHGIPSNKSEVKPATKECEYLDGGHSPALEWAECDMCNHEVFSEKRASKELHLLCCKCLRSHVQQAVEKARKEWEKEACKECGSKFVHMHSCGDEDGGGAYDYYWCNKCNKRR